MTFDVGQVYNGQIADCQWQRILPVIRINQTDTSFEWQVELRTPNLDMFPPQHGQCNNL